MILCTICMEELCITVSEVVWPKVCRLDSCLWQWSWYWARLSTLAQLCQSGVGIQYSGFMTHQDPVFSSLIMPKVFIQIQLLKSLQTLQWFNNIKCYQFLCKIHEKSCLSLSKTLISVSIKSCMPQFFGKFTRQTVLSCRVITHFEFSSGGISPNLRP